jgi:hypothetical protein
MRNLRVMSSLLVLVAASIAGCVSEPAPVGGPGPSEPPLIDPIQAIKTLLEGVPCQATVDENKVSDNLRQLANLSQSEGLHAEIDISGDLLIWARYGAGGFEIVNISNPLEPRLIASFAESGGALDVKFSPDNTTVFLGRRGGIAIVDIRDLENPVETGMWRFPTMPPPPSASQNAHMLFTKRIAGSDWLFLAPNSNTGIWIFKIEGEPGAVKLTKVAQTLPIQGSELGPHDMFVGKDAISGDYILYSADGFEGWSAWNVNNPASPMILTRVLLADPYQGYTHTVQAAKIGDRRIVATIQEVGHNALKIYDATNINAPLLLGTWKASDTADPAAPQHNLNIVGDKLYVAHYNRGFYIFNLSALPALPLTGFHMLQPMAHWTRNTNVNQGALGFNGVWEVALKDGVLYASDVNQLRVIGFGCNTVGDPTLTSVG